MLRRCLDRLYLWSGYLSALFLCGVGFATVLQIVGRFIHVAFDGMHLASFTMASSTFFGLAYTLRSGSHIRVDIFIRNVDGAGHRIREIWCCGIGAIAMGYFVFQASILVMQSYEFSDISSGLLKIPLWIPQIGMVLGSAILTVALVDEFFSLINGRSSEYKSHVT